MPEPKRTSRAPTAVIIAVNPMPRIYAKSLVRHLISTHNVKVLTFYRSQLFDSELEHALVATGADIHQLRFKGRLDEFLQLRRAGRLLRSWLATEDVDVFHCQPNHLLTNYLTFTCYLQEGLRVHLIPDGVANFYLTDTSPYERSMRLKQMIGALVGMRFHRYHGNYLGLGEAEYKSYWYFGDAGIMGDYLPLREFPSPERPRTEAPQEGCLFLGQPESSERSTAAYDAILARARQLGGLLHYKPHPAEKLDGQRRAQIERAGYVILDTSEPAEVLAVQYQSIAGIASSVLFNVRLLGWHDNVYGVNDVATLEGLLGRGTAEVRQIATAASALGIRPL